MAFIPLVSTSIGIPAKQETFKDTFHITELEAALQAHCGQHLAFDSC
ncbi:hypothetical protein OK016_08060 [Vibrio chagasii]|nr:hypothetical protein [Vibrio chagasii]